ncbi:hypothetical protein LDENG_00245940, partial [Lucifuga dentata]
CEFEKGLLYCSLKDHTGRFVCLSLIYSIFIHVTLLVGNVAEHFKYQQVDFKSRMN